MSDAPAVPPSVRSFVTEQISSIEQLEVLLFLRVNPARGWTAAEVSGELRGSPLSVLRRLGDLRDRGFLRSVEGVEEATFVYSPRTPELAMQSRSSRLLTPSGRTPSSV